MLVRNLAAAVLFSLMAFAVSAAPPLTTADSGWYEAGVNNQLNIAIDAQNGGSYCAHRLSVMYIQPGSAGIVGTQSNNAPFQLPLTLPLYRPPSEVPIGSITISALGSSPQITLNGVTGPWRRAVAYNGTNSCEIEVPAPPPRRDPHCARPGSPTGYYCGG